MKKGFLSVFVLAILLSACSSNSKKVDAKDAEKVEVKQTATTVTYNQISEGSHVAWRAAHLGGVQPRYGKIFAKSGKILVNEGRLSNASFEFDMSSFTVENFDDEERKNKLRAHLQNEDFFNIEKFPISKFEMTELVESTEGDYNSTITGNLTIMDVAKSITFDANVSAGVDKINVKSEKFSVNREDWGLTYNKEGTAGVPAQYIIAKGIDFTIDMSVSK